MEKEEIFHRLQHYTLAVSEGGETFMEVDMLLLAEDFITLAKAQDVSQEEFFSRLVTLWDDITVIVKRRLN